MTRMKHFVVALVSMAALSTASAAAERTISREDLLDKVSGYWIGQLVGNYMGFPFETVYSQEPCPVFIDHYYNYQNAGTLKINTDRRGFVNILVDMFEGAFTDDDTDVEFVTLHAVERYGLDLNYPQIAEMWKRHINRNIWVANRTARTLMDKGMIPPETGKKENNQNWFQIDPQLVNEIWSVFYPGMLSKAAQRAEWGARITNDDWGTHPTIAYGVMYSAAFFEKDVNRLVALALERIPPNSPFAEGMRDLIQWRKEHDDWRVTRDLMHKKYYRYVKNGYEAPVSIVSSLINGLAGVMAILYGDGDFVKTTGIAVTAGYDCDNQAATCAGLIGVLHGASAIPDRFTKAVGRQPWDKPFNDQYINFSRDDLPICNRITDIVQRITAISEKAILQNGGRKVVQNGKEAFMIQCDF
jgi:ADP-ribosylglycohydrolase